ncbi:MAG TPA: hypothetical protein DCE42_04210 [Myxococcales bacterium]|nr:hypothetical protein [Deltaproteobacteria bacterium]MBU47687.1 hypothetical protein [Deltaproteobacteria bacterium]HAA53930.1 hypothetical protein [Myxococcales bacterium]|tara:strand:+ start:21642 stop:22217 length:576 start_codon:yes stop_codon:yes gene_type:complete
MQAKRGKKNTHHRQKRGDYRIFIGAFPEGELIDRLQQVREQYDLRTSQITAPHVTIAGTYWRDGAPSAENEANTLAQFAALEGSIPAFDMTLGGIHTFGKRVVYLGAQADAMLSIRETLIETLGRDKHKTFSPHLTLAMRLKPDGVRQMVEELRETEWESSRCTVRIETLQYMLRGPEDPAWRCIATLPLT